MASSRASAPGRHLVSAVSAVGSRQGVSSLLTELRIAFGVALALPVLIPYASVLVLGGNLVRFAFPVYVLAASMALVLSRRGLYPAFIIAVFAYAAFLRRVADYSGGFVLFNPILLAPYLGLLPTVPSLVRRVLGRRSGSVWPFVVFLSCMAYGTFVAILNGAALVSTFYEPIRWLMPISLCAFILDQPAQGERIRRNLVASLLVILPVLVIYGVYQYFVAPVWDVSWMINIDNPTFGLPEPFKIRVFSTMNAPFSVAAFATMAMILLAGEGLLGLAVAGLGIPLLALTLVRTAWVGLVVGFLVLFLNAPPSRQALLLLGSLGIVFACMLIISSPVVPPQVATTITDRLATFQDLKTDDSANERLGVYDAFYNRLADNPFGEGFGVNQSIVTLQNKQANQALDSGILETYLVFGVVAGSAYFLALGALVLDALRLTRHSPARLAGCMAVVSSVLAMSFFGSAQVGEVGVMEWAALGIMLAHGQPACQA